MGCCGSRPGQTEKENEIFAPIHSQGPKNKIITKNKIQTRSRSQDKQNVGIARTRRQETQRPELALILNEYERLQNLNSEFHELYNEISEKMSVNRISETVYENEETLFLVKQLAILAGSMSEGTAICRYAAQKAPHLEVDIMGSFAKLDKADKHLLEPVNDKIGYYNLKYDAKVIQRSTIPLPKMQAYVKGLHDQLKTDEYFTGLKLKQFVAEEEAMYQQNVRARGYKHTAGYAYCKYFTEKYPKKKVTSNSSTSFVGPSVSVIFEVFVDEIPVFLWTIDRVFAIFLDFWPEEANEFLQRDRKWPSPEQIQNIVARGCHIVAKESIAWRVSFSVVETEMAKLRTDDMKLIYLIAKSIFYVNIKTIEVDDQHVPSYALKTVMMWEQERQHTNFWVVDNIKDSLSKIFTVLSKNLGKGHLPSYFLPSLNVIEDKPKELLSQASCLAQNVANEPIRFAAESIKVMDIDTLPDRLDVIHWLYENIDMTLTPIS